MEALIRFAGLCLVAAVAAALLRRDTPEMGLLLTAAAVLTGGVLLLGAASELAGLWDELTVLTGLSPAVFTPLVKVTAIALVARVGAAFCTDAGQTALARLMDAAGALCALECAVPLLRAVTDLIRGWL